MRTKTLTFSSINLSAKTKLVQTELQDALSAKLRGNQIHYLISFFEVQQIDEQYRLVVYICNRLPIHGSLFKSHDCNEEDKPYKKLKVVLEKNYAEFYKQFGSNIMINGCLTKNTDMRL